MVLQILLVVLPTTLKMLEMVLLTMPDILDTMHIASQIVNTMSTTPCLLWSKALLFHANRNSNRDVIISTYKHKKEFEPHNQRTQSTL